MKYYSLILIFLFSIKAYALQGEVKPLDGIYFFDKEIKVLSQKSSKQVYVGSEEGKQNLEQFKKQGYQCNVLTSVMYICSKFIANSILGEDLEKEIIKKNSNILVEFFPEKSIDLESSGDSLKVWNVQQEVKYNEHDAFGVKYYHLKDISKLQFEVEEEKIWLNIYDRNSIAMPYMFRVETDKFSNESYFVELILRKIN